jgi:hypothetical protein
MNAASYGEEVMIRAVLFSLNLHPGRDGTGEM